MDSSLNDANSTAIGRATGHLRRPAPERVDPATAYANGYATAKIDCMHRGTQRARRALGFHHARRNREWRRGYRDCIDDIEDLSRPMPETIPEPKTDDAPYIGPPRDY